MTFDPCSFKADPGPCPIDDSHHTTCVSPGYSGRSYREVIVVQPDPSQLIVGDTSPLARLPAHDQAGARARPDGRDLTPSTGVVQTFSTSEYRGRTKRGPR